MNVLHFDLNMLLTITPAIIFCIGCTCLYGLKRIRIKAIANSLEYKEEARKDFNKTLENIDFLWCFTWLLVITCGMFISALFYNFSENKQLRVLEERANEMTTQLESCREDYKQVQENAQKVVLDNIIENLKN